MKLFQIVNQFAKLANVLAVAKQQILELQG